MTTSPEVSGLSALQAAVAMARQTAMSKQDGLATLMANVLQAVANGPLPLPVQAAVQQLMALHIPTDSTPTADTIRTALTASGLFTEAEMAKTGEPPADLKTALGQLNKAAQDWAAKVPSRDTSENLATSATQRSGAALPSAPAAFSKESAIVTPKPFAPNSSAAPSSQSPLLANKIVSTDAAKTAQTASAPPQSTSPGEKPVNPAASPGKQDGTSKTPSDSKAGSSVPGSSQLEGQRSSAQTGQSPPAATLKTADAAVVAKLLATAGEAALAPLPAEPIPAVETVAPPLKSNSGTASATPVTTPGKLNQPAQDGSNPASASSKASPVPSLPSLLPSSRSETAQTSAAPSLPKAADIALPAKPLAAGMDTPPVRQAPAPFPTDQTVAADPIETVLQTFVLAAKPQSGNPVVELQTALDKPATQAGPVETPPGATSSPTPSIAPPQQSEAEATSSSTTPNNADTTALTKLLPMGVDTSLARQYLTQLTIDKTTDPIKAVLQTLGFFTQLQSSGELPADPRNGLSALNQKAQDSTGKTLPNDKTELAARSPAAPPPQRGGAPVGQSAASPTLPKGGDAALTAKLLAAGSEAALARQNLMQLASLPDEQHPAQTRWVAEVPLMTPQGASVAQLIVERDSSNTSAEQPQPVWRVGLAMDIEPLGPVRANLALSGDHAWVTIAADRPESLAQLQQGAGWLSEALMSSSLEADIAFQSGPAAKPRNGYGRGTA